MKITKLSVNIHLKKDHIAAQEIKLHVRVETEKVVLSYLKSGKF